MDAKIARFRRPTKSPDLSAKLEHILSSTILLADFLSIGQQILFTLPWWLFATKDEYLF